MRGLGILILIVLFFWILGPTISKWLKRKAMEKAEDYMRSSMGLPPREKKRKTARSGEYRQEKAYSGRERRNPFGPDRYTNEPIIPKEYAEDVEFTEIKEYSSREYIRTETQGAKIVEESQISDAEFIEIKKSRTK